MRRGSREGASSNKEHARKDGKKRRYWEKNLRSQHYVLSAFAPPVSDTVHSTRVVGVVHFNLMTHGAWLFYPFSSSASAEVRPGGGRMQSNIARLEDARSSRACHQHSHGDAHGCYYPRGTAIPVSH